MKFKEEGQNFYSHTVSESNINKLSFGDLSRIKRTPFLNTIIEDKVDEKLISLSWLNIITYDGNEIFRRESIQRYYISEFDIPPIDADLYDVVAHSYFKTKEDYNSMRSQFIVLPLMVNIPPDTILQYLPQLRSTLQTLQA